MGTDVDADARRFHDQQLVFLGYTVTPVQVSRRGATLAHMAQRLPGAKVDLPKLVEGGVNAVFLSTGIESISISDAPRCMWLTDPLPELLRFVAGDCPKMAMRGNDPCGAHYLGL